MRVMPANVNISQHNIYKIYNRHRKQYRKSGCVFENKQNQSGYTNKMHKKMREGLSINCTSTQLILECYML